MNWIIITLIGGVLYLFKGDDKRAKALRKARAAKKRYSRSTGKKRKPVKRSKAELREMRLRNLKKARAAKKKKK